MTDAALSRPKLADFWDRIAAAPLWTWCIAALLIYLGVDVLPDPPNLAASLGDSDDAMRLTQVREFLAGASWFDTTLPRFGSPEHLVSHWSRLVDLPLATLIAVFGLFMPQADAELAMRWVWPLLLLGALFFAMGRAAEERGGRLAVVLAFILVILSFSALQQFRPGRIDHHNVQNLAAFAGVLLLAGAFANPRRGMLAGIVLGLGMAAGIEAILISGSALAVAALIAAVTGRGRMGIERAVVSFAATLAAAFAVTTAPSNWFDVKCDALSLNLVLLSAAGAAGVVGVLRNDRALSLPVRVAVLAAAGVSAAGIYFYAQPACLAGPFGQVDPAVYPVWLNLVSETRDITWLYKNVPPAAIAIALQSFVGLAAVAYVLRKERDEANVLYAAVFAIAVAVALLQMKLVPYAALFAILPIALALAHIRGTDDVSAQTLQFAGVTLLNQKSLLITGAILFGATSPASDEYKKRVEAKQACLANESMAPLAALPGGLAVSETDFGPYFVALTNLNALAAPYHRIDKSIIEAHTILTASPAEAERRLRSLGAAYVVVCKPLADLRRDTTLAAETLKMSLPNGNAPAFLKAVPLTATTPLMVWRLKPN